MDVLMPQLGETVAEGTVSGWHKQAGDDIVAGEALLDVETDKVSMEIAAPKSGKLTRVLVPAGETVAVGTVLAVIRVEGETETAAEPVAPTTVEPAQAAAETTAPSTASTAPAQAVAPAAASRGDRQQRLSPAVRRLVAEHKLDIGAIEGTGRNGRITRRNVVEFIESGAASATSDDRRDTAAEPFAPTTPPAPIAPAAPSPVGAAEPTAKRIPFNRIRKRTADHMVRSKATSPHVLQAVEVDFSAVDRVRHAVRESWKTRNGYSLTFLPFVARAVCSALEEFPHINSTVGDDELILHDRVNLAIAIDLGSEGLVAPVIRSAETMSVTELAASINDLATRARGHRLTADDLSGGTYTLSNSGTFGTLITAPIINQPQVAILSTDGVRKKPVVIESPDGDSIAIRPIGVLAQSFDHRAFDGAYSAAFLDRVRHILERNDWLREI